MYVNNVAANPTWLPEVLKEFEDKLLPLCQDGGKEAAGTAAVGPGPPVDAAAAFTR